MNPAAVETLPERSLEKTRWPMRLAKAMVKNVAALALVAGGWLALATGYLTPDRPTRDQWQTLERARAKPSGTLVYQSNFSLETPGEGRNPTGVWGRYNGATVSTVTFDPGGVTVKYGGTPWIGAVFTFKAYERQRIYRLTIDRVVEGAPAAVIVRNRLMDLERAQIPVGSGPFKLEFIAPLGGLDRVIVAFIPDGTDKPEGMLRITSLKIERLED